MGLRELKLTLDYQRRSDTDLNNKINAVKVKYGMTDDDLVIINVAISTLTARKVIAKMGGGK